MSAGKENKPHIGIYGKRNVGKSSLINSIAGQQISIVADFKGTTTDPVKKSFEIPNVGPAIIIDTAGIDDSGDIGKLRVEKTLKTISQIDLAIIVITEGKIDTFEEKLIAKIQKAEIPFFIINNKTDLYSTDTQTKNKISNKYDTTFVEFSSLNDSPDTIIQLIGKLMPDNAYSSNSLIGDIIDRGDVILLVTPIDSEAPQGRLILPQVQVIRDILDNNCIAVVVKEDEIETFLNTGIKPKLVITDSQVFNNVNKLIPKEIPLTGFSIVLARLKGDFKNYLIGTPKIADLQDHDKVLILESCSHHVSCDDIGRIKIPQWINDYTGKTIDFTIVSGLDNLPNDISEYALVVQCGGCVLTKKQLLNRLRPAIDAGVPITNYGMLIAYIHGIYNRAIEVFTE